MSVSLWSQSRAALGKDLLLEWRGRGRAFADVCFAAVALLLFSFAVGPDSAAQARHAPGFLWLAILLGSTLALQQAWAVELEDGALDGLLQLPVDPRALFFAKATSMGLRLLLLATSLLPFAFVLYGVALDGPPYALLLALLLGAFGLAAPGTLFAAMTARASGKEVLLPLLLFPLVVPVLLAAVKATSLALTGDPMDQAPSWLGVLACFDTIYMSLCALLFPRVLEDG